MRLLVTFIATTLLLAACATGLADDDRATPAGGGGARTATPTQLAPLRIVTPTPVTPGASPTGQDVPTPPAENPATYVVQEGDTLYAIALRFGVDLEALIELNGLSDPNDIVAGQELKIPPRQ